MKVVQSHSRIDFHFRFPATDLLAFYVAGDRGTVWRLMNSSLKPMPVSDGQESQTTPAVSGVRLTGPFTIKRVGDVAPEEVVGEDPSVPDEEFAAIVTFGEVPHGMTQSVPEKAVPSLSAGHIYMVVAIGTSKAERAMFKRS